MKYVRCIHNSGNEASLTIGTIYQVLPITDVEKASGMIRIIDNEGEDYLYPDHWFDPISDDEAVGAMTEQLTVHLSTASKVAIRDMANAQGSTMSTLVRAWIDERLDLPVSN